MSSTITIYFQGVGTIPEGEIETTITLPNYDPTLTLNVQVTPIYNNMVRILNVSKITNSSFTVYGLEESTFFPLGPSGDFNWIVYGTPSNVAIAD